LEFFTTLHADVKKYFKYTCTRLGVRRLLCSSCFYSHGTASGLGLFVA